MAYYPSVLLPCPRQEPRHVFYSQQWYVEGITSSDESGRLVGSVYIQASGSEIRLIGYHPYRRTVQPDEAGYYILRVMRHHIIYPAVIGQLHYHVIHIVSLVRYDIIQFRYQPVDIIRAIVHRRIFHVIGRHIAEKLSDHQQRLLIVLPHEVCHSADSVMSHGTAQLFSRH